MTEDPNLRDEGHLHAFLEAGLMGTWSWDIQRGIVSWSEGLERIHGLEPGSFGGTFDVYQSFIHPEDRERVTAAIRDALAGLDEYRADYRMVKPDGTTQHVEARGRVLRDAAGLPLRMVGLCSDVSDRHALLERERNARIETEQSELQYRTLAGAIPQQVWTAGPDGALDFVNQRVVEFFGLPAEQVIGEGWQTVIHPEDLPDVVAQWTRSLSTGEEYEVEFRLRRHDGAYRWYLGRAIPVRDPSGRIVRWLGTNTDIDGRKKSLRLISTQADIANLLVRSTALEEVSESILETFCRNLSWDCAMIWSVESDSLHLERVAGWRDPSISDRDWLAVSSAPSLKPGEGFAGEIQNTGAPVWAESLSDCDNARAVRESGFVSAFGFPLIVEGKVRGVVEAFSREAKPPDPAILRLADTLGSHLGQFMERQAAQRQLDNALKRLRRLQDVTDVALANLPLQRLFDNLLKKVCEVTGCELGVLLLLDMSANELYPVAVSGENIELPVDMRIQVGEGVAGCVAVSGEMRIIPDAAESELRPEVRAMGFKSLLALPLQNHDRRMGVMLMGSRTHRDFTSEDTELIQLVAGRVSIALENSLLYEQTREANRIKDHFLAIASHELRSPITSILGWTSLLASDDDPSLRSEGLSAIEQSARSQAQLIEDLLDSSRIREGKLSLRKEPFDLPALAVAVVRGVNMMAEAAGVHIDCRVPEEGLLINGDRERIRQVLLNLVGNAIKFTPSGRNIRIQVSSDVDAAIVVVEDEGKGIDPRFLPRIFNAFEQDEQDSNAGGLGLGLHIAQTLVSLHGGTLEAFSDGPGRGARFVVRLPR